MDDVKKSFHSSEFRLLAYENIAIHLGCTSLQQYYPDVPERILTLFSEPTICEEVIIQYIFLYIKLQ